MRRLATMASVCALALFHAFAAVAQPTVTVVHPFDITQGQLPESVAPDDAGNLYLTVSGSVYKYTADHQMLPFATIPVPPGAVTLGIKVGPDGFLYVVGAAFDPSLAASSVWKVSTTGQVSLVASLPAEGIPNDLAIDDHGTLYVTDSGLGRIWKIGCNGTPEIWIEDPLLLGNAQSPVGGVRALGANGLAFDRNFRNLYVANTDYGRIVRIRNHHGRAGAVETFTQSELLQGADGIAFDAHGKLNVTVNIADRIATVDRQGNVAVLVEGAPLDAPSNIAFGATCQDRHTLYIVNFAIMRAMGIKPGMPQPSLAKITVPVPGLLQ